VKIKTEADFVGTYEAKGFSLRSFWTLYKFLTKIWENCRVGKAQWTRISEQEGV